MLAAVSDFYTLAAIIVLGVFTSVTAPMLLARRMDREHHRDRLEDWARQDAVAAQAAEAAGLLAVNTLNVEQTAAKTNEQLIAIHTAVNSNLTARITETLIATQAQLTLMQRLLPDPNDEETSTMARLAATIAELTAQLTDRHAGGT